MEGMVGRVAADRSTKLLEVKGGVVDRTRVNAEQLHMTVHTNVSLLRSRFGTAIGSLVSRLGNSSSFVSQILNSTMLVTPKVVVHCEIGRSLYRLTTPLNHDTIKSSIIIRELTQTAVL